MDDNAIEKLAHNAPNGDPAQKDAIERVLLLYRERLQLQAEMRVLELRLSEVNTNIREHTGELSDLAELLGANVAIATQGPPPSLRTYTKNDATAPAPEFRLFMRANQGKELTKKEFKEKLGHRYGDSTISGNLTYYKKKGLVKNTSRGRWLIAKNIPVE